MHIRVAGAQIPVRAEVAANTATLQHALEKAHAAGADILLTPEGSLSGYTPVFDAAAVETALSEITAQARAWGIGLALGTCYVEADGRVYNEIRFYGQDGAYLGFHSKILRCGTLEKVPQGEIQAYATTPLRTFAWNGNAIGGLICNDLWANPECTPVADPHLTQLLAQMGARAIFHAVNGGRDGSTWSDVAWDYHESNLRMRARAGRLWIITVDNCDPQAWRCSAPSGVVSPDGEWIARAPDQGEHVFVITIDV